MADQRISQLFEITSSGVSADDVLAIVDVNVSQTKKVTSQNLAEAGFRLANNASLDIAKINQNSATKIDSAAIASGAITAPKMAALSVATASLQDNAVTTVKITDSNVTTAKIADLAVTTGKLAATGVTSAKIANSAVGTTQLADSGVTTVKIANDAVTYAKIQNVSATDRLLGRSTAGAGDVEEIVCTSAGRALLDDVDAAAQRATLGLGNIALASGTWTNGASVSGSNTGDQTIVLTGAITGTGTGGITTSLSNSAVTTATLADSNVTTAKLADSSVTAAKLADDSSVVVATSLPVSGDFEGQICFNSSTGLFYIWTGASWQQNSDVTDFSFAVASGVSSPIALTGSVSNKTATISQDLNTQPANTVFAGPLSGADAKPTFRALDPSDLPTATNSTLGIARPGSGLTIFSNGVISHNTATTPGSYYKVTIDGNGHVTAGNAVLVANDIPALDASKITTGTFSNAYIADDAIDGKKIADRVVCQFGESRPAAGDFVGQLFFDPINKDTYVWDSNVWQEISITAGSIVLAGLYNATTNKITSLTGAGAAVSGFTVSGVIPTANSGSTGYYFLVTTSGVGSGNAPNKALTPPDLIVSDGSAWYEVDVSSSYVSQTAASISFTPAGQIAGSNVQTAIEEVSTECRDATNITSGTLAVARGGTNITSYTKGDLLVGSGSTIISKLTVGTNNQVLTADSTTALGVKWANATNGTVTTVSGTSPVSVINPTTAPVISIANATTSSVGAVQLSDSVSTTSSSLAATSTAVKSAYDLANAALPKSGGALTGTVSNSANYFTSSGFFAGSSTVGNLRGVVQSVYVKKTSNASMGVENTSNNSQGSEFVLAKSRSGGQAALNDTLGIVSFIGYANSDPAHANAWIRASVDETQASGSAPGRLAFSTTPSGSTVPVERQRIDSRGRSFFTQATPITLSGNTTLTADQMLNGMIFGDPPGAIATYTLTTGSDLDAAIPSPYNDMAFRWSVSNLDAVYNIVLSGNTGHTISGLSNGIDAKATAMFLTRRVTTNTWVTYIVANKQV